MAVCAQSDVLFLYDSPGNLTTQTNTATVPLPQFQQSVPQYAIANSNGLMSVSAPVTGAGKFTYQWLLNGVAIAGATNGSFLLTNTATANLGAYQLVASNSTGSATSAVVNVSFDIDHNGLPDAWEITYFGHTGIDPKADPDGDGVNNYNEYLDGTNPTNANSVMPRLNLYSTFGGTASVTPYKPKYQLGDTVQITALPNAGNAFISWSGSITNTNTTVSLIMNFTKTVTASFGMPLAQVLDGTNLVWTTGGDRGWFGQTNTTFDGVSAAQSGVVLVGQQTWLQTIITNTNESRVSFHWAVSSEAGVNFLTFNVNGNAYTNISGGSGSIVWQSQTSYLPPGTNVLRWVYAQNFADNDYGWIDLDTGWLDQVVVAQVADVFITGTNVVEGNIGSTNALFTVSLDKPFASPVVVSFTTANGTAIAGSDYIATNGTLTFGVGQTSTNIVVRVLGDVFIETNETFFLNLTAVTNAFLVTNQVTATIINDDGLPGQAYQLVWDPIGGVQRTNNPFTGTITARDSTGTIATNFSPAATLSAWAAGTDTNSVSGVGISTTSIQPLYTYYPQARSQTIYLTNEVGGAGMINALALDTAIVPGITLTNFTIRLRHALQVDYSGGYYWETNGWATVYQTNLTIISTGLVNCVFSTPFYYNGTNNLLVDFTFSNATYTAAGAWRYTTASSARAMYYYTSGYGDPRSWYGTYPSYYTSTAIPNLRFTRTPLVPATLSTNNAVPFISGAWTGLLSVPQPASQVRLLVDDGNGHTGWSSPFDVLAGNDVALYLTSTPNPVSVLSNLTYQLTVANSGPTDATGVTVTNTLPANVNLVSAVSSQGSVSTNGGLVVCNFGTLTNLAVATANIIVTPTIAGIVLTNVASMVRSEVDANLANNIKSNTVTVLPVGINVSDISLIEGNTGTTNAVFTLTLNAPSAQTVTVNYNTTNGTAIAGSDYVVTSGVVTFPIGTTNQVITVPVFGDIFIESNEVFYVQLSNSSNSIIVRPLGTATIINDDGLAGQTYQLVWDPIGGVQRISTPFTGAITARDSAGTIATNFSPAATLSAWAAGTDTNTVSGAATSTTTVQPLYTYYPQARSQTIYLTNEVGGAGMINALALDTATVPGTTLTNFTIRLRHTSQVNYSGGYYWETNGWMTIYQTNLNITSTGLVNCAFSTPFYYNGTNSLLVDFSFSNATYTTAGAWRYTSASSARAMYYYTSGYGDPRLWYGTYPSYYTSTAIPNLRFTRTPLVPATLSPNNAAPFISGAWTGPLSMSQAASQVRLLADDGNGHTGWSSSFDVLVGNDVALYLTGNPNPVNVLSNLLTYQLTVVNSGPTDATGVTVTNTLPAGVNLVSAISSQGSVSTNGGMVVCNFGTLTNLAVVTATVVVTPTIAGAILTNVASVTRNEVDANLANNVITNIVTVGSAGVSIGDTSVIEGNSGTTNAMFVVMLNAPSAQTVTVGYTTANGTAIAGSDFTATNGVATFAAGVTSQVVAVPIIGDISVESNELFYVNLSSPTNGILARAQAVGTIINDDGLPGQLHHFAWSVVGSPQVSGMPFPVTITAQDVSNTVATTFSGNVGLGLYSAQTTNILGGILHSSSSSGNWTLGYSFTPGQDIIVTRVRHYFGTKVSIWRNDGSLVVGQNVVSTPGTWVETPLAIPVTLSAGQTYRVGAYTGGGGYYWRTDGGTSFINGTINQSYEISGDAFPASSDSIKWWLVDLAYQVGAGGLTNLVLSPTNTANFINGVWVGNLTMTGNGTNIVLRASDIVGHGGNANAISVVAPTIRFGGTLQMTNGGFKMQLQGLSGVAPVIIYASTNLVVWIPIYTNPPVIGILDFIDVDAYKFSKRFYRATEGNVVTPTILQFDTSPGLFSMTNGGFRLRILGAPANAQTVIWASSNLNSWQSIYTNPAGLLQFDFIDSQASNFTKRFYRATSP